MHTPRTTARTEPGHRTLLSRAAAPARRGRRLRRLARQPLQISQGSLRVAERVGRVVVLDNVPDGGGFGGLEDGGPVDDAVADGDVGAIAGGGHVFDVQQREAGGVLL